METVGGRTGKTELQTGLAMIGREAAVLAVEIEGMRNWSLEL